MNTATPNAGFSTVPPIHLTQRVLNHRALKCARISARRGLKSRESSLTHEFKRCCLIITCLTNAVIRSHREKQSAVFPPPRLFPCFLLGRPLLFSRQFENLPACCLPPPPIRDHAPAVWDTVHCGRGTISVSEF